MNYSSLTPHTMKTSLLGYGCMRFPLLEDKKVDIEEARRLVARAMECGINYYDTAYPYHEQLSESILADLLSPFPRSSYLLADKLPIWLFETREDMERIFEEQLSRCKTEYFDYYLVHAVNRSRIDVLGFLEEKRREGKIRSVGFSFHDTPFYLEEAIKLSPSWDFVQLQINYSDWGTDNAKPLYETAVKYGLPVIVMEPVRGGYLADPPEEVREILNKADPSLTPAAWAMRFVCSLPNVKLVLSGMSSMEQLENNIETFSLPSPGLDEKGLAVIDQAIEALRKVKHVPCTACRYCMDCPSGVDIPNVFKTYNKLLACGYNDSIQSEYTALAADEHGADKCTACGVCAKACPQGIDIPEHMKVIQKHLKK